MDSLAHRPAWVGYVGSVWDYRHFWWSLVHIDLRNRYKRSVLGIGWSLLQPIAMTAVYCYCFHAIFNIELAEYVPFLMTGMAFWGLFSASATEGCQAFYQAQGFIKAERIPLAVYPLRVALGMTLHFAITLVVAVATAAVFKGFDRVLPLLTLVPTVTLLIVFSWSVATLMAFAAVHFPDVPHLATVGLQILFYLTPVMYPPSIINSRGLGDVLRYNPLGYFMHLLRDPIINDAFPSVWEFAIAGGLTTCVAALALWIIKRCEKNLIFALI